LSYKGGGKKVALTKGKAREQLRGDVIVVASLLCLWKTQVENNRGNTGHSSSGKLLEEKERTPNYLQRAVKGKFKGGASQKEGRTAASSPSVMMMIYI